MYVTLEIQVNTLDLPIGLGLYVGLSHPNKRLEIVKLEIEKKETIYGLKSFMEIVNLLSL